MVNWLALSIVLLLGSPLALSASPPGGVPSYPGSYGGYPSGYQFRPPTHSTQTRRSTSFSFGSGSSGNRPPSFRPRGRSNRRVLETPGDRRPTQPHRYAPPRLESSISDPTPWVQQSLLYKIRVISSGDLKTVVADPPESNDLAARQLGEAVTESEQIGGQSLFVTEFRYLVMPLKAGRIELPPARVEITRRPGLNLPQKGVLNGSPLVLQVEPAKAEVQPWLPLYDLRMKADLGNSDAPAVGKPMHLTIQTTAFGATAKQIPSVAAQLKKGDFRVYQDETEIEEGLTRLNDMIYGRRTEHFTLVPRFGGNITLPAVELRWWNTRFSRAESSVLPARRFVATGTPKKIRPWQNVDDRGSFFANRWWLLPLILAFALALYQWYRQFLRGGRGGELLRLPQRFLKALLGGFYAPLARLFGRLSPRRLLHAARGAVGRHLPVSWRLWFCMRALARENDPAGWAQAIQLLGHKHLGIPSNAPLRMIGERIAACHPGTDQEAVTRLMLQLEKTVYGGEPMDDFPAWKRAFNTQIRPRLLNLRLRRCLSQRRPRPRLPELNPRTDLSPHH